MNFIGSPEIVTALALAGRLSFNPLTDTLTGAGGGPPPPAGASRAGASTCLRPASRRTARPTWPRPRTAPGVEVSRARGRPRPITSPRPGRALPRAPAGVQRQPVHGGLNAFTGERGRGRNVLTGEPRQALADIARAWRARSKQGVLA